MLTKDHTQKYSFVYYKRYDVDISPSNNSSDFTISGITRGCLKQCVYCPVITHYPNRQLEVSTNVDEIIEEIDKHVNSLPWPKIPNHTHPRLYTYDIGQFCDIGIDYNSELSKKYDKLFKFIIEHPKIMGVFSTKNINYDMLSDVHPEGKLRVLLSLIPDDIKDLLEPGTTDVIDRIVAADNFRYMGWEVGFLLAPVIVCPGYMHRYSELFKLVDKYCHDSYVDSYFFDVRYLKLSKKSIDKQQDIRIKELLCNPAIQIPSDSDPDMLVYAEKYCHVSKASLIKSIQKYTKIRVRYIN